MLRTSLRSQPPLGQGVEADTFLSSNAQDFIEDHWTSAFVAADPSFLSSNAQDFIED